ncbi:hypothetical protein F5876DRAFT_80992 [Lentinula aff. lateritia]|uniref:Uncharacterized protein n=1 Tax=Lentinula aff. lateritia TaxID=2804960 RepID=A0ACC1TNC5_9AGAR|nr:hypothetical protein F5876DRAFT_80992 [Lentinula aff. lateritia]
MDKLPNEIVANICQHLQSDFAALAALSAVSSRLHLPVNEQLYKTVSDLALPTLALIEFHPSLTRPLFHVHHIHVSDQTSLAMFHAVLGNLIKHRDGHPILSLTIRFPTIELPVLFPNGVPPLYSTILRFSISCSCRNPTHFLKMMGSFWTASLTDLTLDFAHQLHPSSYDVIEQLFSDILQSCPSLASWDIRLPTKDLNPQPLRLQNLLDDTTFTFHNLIIFRILLPRTTLSFANFLLRHPKIKTFAFIISRYPTDHAPYLGSLDVLPVLKSFHGSLSTTFSLVGGIHRPLHSLVLSYPGHSLHEFHQLTHVLRATPTLRALEFAPVVGATLGEIRSVTKCCPSLVRFTCTVQASQFYDKPSDVEALYHVICNNLLNVNVVRVSFVPTNDVDFGLSHKHAIQKAYKSSHDFRGSSPGIQMLEGCYHTVIITFYDNIVLWDCEL